MDAWKYRTNFFFFFVYSSCHVILWVIHYYFIWWVKSLQWSHLLLYNTLCNTGLSTDHSPGMFLYLCLHIRLCKGMLFICGGGGGDSGMLLGENYPWPWSIVWLSPSLCSSKGDTHQHVLNDGGPGGERQIRGQVAGCRGASTSNTGTRKGIVVFTS